MKIKTPLSFQTFNDGVCSIWRVENTAAPGKAPKEGLTVKYGRIPFERRKVGLTRFYRAMQADVKVTDLIRIPKQTGIHTNEVCIIDGATYRIKQVQLVPDALPPSVDLTLEGVEVDYDVRTVL